MRLSLFKKLMIIPMFASLMSCEKLDKVGPDLCPPDDFVFADSDLKIDVLSVSNGTRVETPLASANATVDLDGEGMHIYAGMSQSVKWKLEITMDDGSAKKVFSGESDTVDVFWYGNSIKSPLFKEGKATVRFKILCSVDIQKEVTLKNSPTFKNTDPRFGMLLRDWDQNGYFPIQTIGSPDFTWGTGDGFLWASDNFVAEYLNEDPSPAGGYYFSLYDTRDSKVWYYGASGINSSNFGDMIDSLPTNDPSELWFNIYIKGDQEYKNTSAELVLSTADGNFLYSEHVNWEGWKLVSFKMTDFKNGTVPLATTSGGSYLAFQLGSQPQKDSEAQVSYDFPIITVGGPLFEE